jgi:cysteinyl-tRNA synthetase
MLMEHARACSVEKIVSRGLAYSGASGSVYLDIAAFKEQGHHYRKLVPFSGETSEADMVRAQRGFP